MSACTFCTAAFFSSSAAMSCVPASLSLMLSPVDFTVSGASPAVGSSVPGVAAVVLLSAGVSSPSAATASASFCSAAGTATCCSSGSAAETATCCSSGSAAGAASCCSSCSVTASASCKASCANAVMGSVEKQRINASNMLNTRFFIPFYLFPLGIVIPIILKITYHTFSQRNQGLHESTQICHESTEEDFKWLNVVQ